MSERLVRKIVDISESAAFQLKETVIKLNRDHPDRKFSEKGIIESLIRDFCDGSIKLSSAKKIGGK